MKTCDNQRARAHAESDEACRRRRGAAAPAGQGVVARQDVPHWDHLRVRRCRSLFRGKIVCLSSSTKILSVASGTRGRGGPVPIDFRLQLGQRHPSRAGSLRSERGSESSRQHRNRDAVKGRVVTRDFRSVRKCYCIAPRVDAGESCVLDSREEMHGGGG